MKYYVCAKFQALIVFGYRVMPSESGKEEDEEFLKMAIFYFNTFSIEIIIPNFGRS